ncbi:hypothetical protein Y022_06710 [Streptococcus thermophilus TH1477]|nr:hypothetical protein [Streptococcus thermophilus]EWM61535.1 hypothetical protein Y022_06710 [Streptococcus thermophilus TH1477]
MAVYGTEGLVYKTNLLANKSVLELALELFQGSFTKKYFTLTN